MEFNQFGANNMSCSQLNMFREQYAPVDNQKLLSSVESVRIGTDAVLTVSYTCDLNKV